MQVRRLFALVCLVVVGVCGSVHWFLSAEREPATSGVQAAEQRCGPVAEADAGLNCPMRELSGDTAKPAQLRKS